MIYVDDCGKPEQRFRNNRYFCLSAVILYDKDWRNVDAEIEALKKQRGIPEIHTRNIFRMEKEFVNLQTRPLQRLFILGGIFSLIARLNVTLISSIIDKENTQMMTSNIERGHTFLKDVIWGYRIYVKQLAMPMKTE